MDPNNPGGTFVFVALIVSLGVVLGLRRFAPDRPRLAIFLAVLFGPCGHLYMKGAGRYILLMYLAWGGLLIFTPLPPLVSGILLSILSGLLMNARLRQQSVIQDPQKGDS